MCIHAVTTIACVCSFHFVEGAVQLADLKYGGSLVLLSTAVEKGFAVDLKLRKRLTLATKVKLSATVDQFINAL
jgi:hypothetical protein